MAKSYFSREDLSDLEEEEEEKEEESKGNNTLMKEKKKAKNEESEQIRIQKVINQEINLKKKLLNFE